jgi:hypothetical protein
MTTHSGKLRRGRDADAPATAVVIGVLDGSMFFFASDDHSLLHQKALAELHDMSKGDGRLDLTFRKPAGVTTFATDQASEIAELLSGYIDLVLKFRRDGATLDDVADDIDDGTLPSPSLQQIPASVGEDDFTSLPAQIDAALGLARGLDGAVRPTRISVGGTWRKRFQTSLLAAPSEKSLGADELRTEKNKAFDLLDALCKSGALALGNCQRTS